MRGEKRMILFQAQFLVGSPPHARGKGAANLTRLYSHRITPACAGKRARYGVEPKRHRDHPRMRGEKISYPFQWSNILGSPPHARGKEPTDPEFCIQVRITPACAGKSL